MPVNYDVEYPRLQRKYGDAIAKLNELERQLAELRDYHKYTSGTTEPAAVDQYKAKYDMLRRHTVPASMAMSMEIELREIRDDESIEDFVDEYVQQALLKDKSA